MSDNIMAQDAAAKFARESHRRMYFDEKDHAFVIKTQQDAFLEGVAFAAAPDLESVKEEVRRKKAECLKIKEGASLYALAEVEGRIEELQSLLTWLENKKG